MNASQRFRNRLRWGLTEGRKGPTSADLDARIYDVTMEHPVTHTRLSFFVLALDHEQAEEFAWLRAAGMPNPSPDDLEVTCTPRPETSGEMVHAALLVESCDEWTERQHVYAKRTGGPSDEQVANQPGVEGGVRYDRAWEQR